MTRPLVSILINNYNYAPFLRDAIQSALSQDYDNKEVIVVDDGSTDDSRAVIESFGSQIVPVFKPNGGQASAFNAGFVASRGDIVCFLDADDIMFPGKVQRIVEVFASRVGIGWLFHPLHHASSNEVAASIEKFRADNSVPGTLPGQEVDWRANAAKGTLGYLPTATSGMCFRRRLLLKLLPMPEAIRITSDNYLKYAAAGLEVGYLADAPLAILRRHGNNAYTGRTDINAGKAEIVMRIAYWLSKEFPHLHRLADREFAYAMGVFRALGFRDTNDHLIESYLLQVSRPRRARLLLWSSPVAMIARRLVRPFRHPYLKAESI